MELTEPVKVPQTARIKKAIYTDERGFAWQITNANIMGSYIRSFEIAPHPIGLMDTQMEIRKKREIRSKVQDGTISVLTEIEYL